MIDNRFIAKVNRLYTMAQKNVDSYIEKTLVEWFKSKEKQILDCSKAGGTCSSLGVNEKIEYLYNSAGTKNKVISCLDKMFKGSFSYRIYVDNSSNLKINLYWD